jgi:hypothetical protein
VRKELGAGGQVLVFLGHAGGRDCRRGAHYHSGLVLVWRQLLLVWSTLRVLSVHARQHQRVIQNVCASLGSCALKTLQGGAYELCLDTRVPCTWHVPNKERACLAMTPSLDQSMNTMTKTL